MDGFSQFPKLTYVFFYRYLRFTLSPCAPHSLTLNPVSRTAFVFKKKKHGGVK